MSVSVSESVDHSVRDEIQYERDKICHVIKIRCLCMKLELELLPHTCLPCSFQPFRCLATS
jgi:hypothetical protein